MLFYLGLFVIFFLGSLKISLPYLPSRLQSKKIKQLLEMGNIDKVLTLLKAPVIQLTVFETLFPLFWYSL